MGSKGLSSGIYQPLSPAGIETIHSASLTIVDEIRADIYAPDAGAAAKAAKMLLR